MELRAPHFDPTAMLFITILTKQKGSDDVKIVGYSAINLFLNFKTFEQPKSEAENVIN